MIHVSVPNVGVVAFPDDFTPERIDAEIRQNFADKLGLQDQPAPIVPEATEAPGLFDQATRAVKGFFDDNNIRSAPASVSDSGYSSPITGVFKDLATPGPSTQYDEQNEAVSKRVGNMPARMLRAGAGGMEAAGNLGNYQLPPKAESLSDLAAMPAQAALKFWDSLLGKAIPEDTKDNLKRDAQFLREATNDELQQNAANPAPGLPTLVTDTAGAVADMVPFIATGSAPLALGGMSAYAGGSKYADYIEQGKTPQQALHAGISTALAEGLSEKIPVSAILKKGQGKEWFDAIFGEGLQEGFMSLFEQTYDKTHLDNLSFADAVRNIDWNDAAYQAVIGSTVGGTLKTAATPVQALQQSAIDQQRNDQNRQQNSEALALLDQVIQANNQQQPARDAAAQQQANNALRDKIKQDLATREERAWQKPPGTQPALVGETVIEPQVVRKIPVVPDEQITAPGQGATAYPLGQGTQNPPLVLEDMRQPKTPEQYAEGLYKPQSQAKVSDTDIQQPEQKQALASDTKPDVVTQPVTKAGAEMMGKPQGGAVSEDNNSVEPKDKDGFTYRVTRLNNGRQVRSRVFSEQEALDILRAVETGDKNKIDALLPTNNHRYDFRRQGNKFHGSIQVDDRFTAPGKLHPVAVTIGGAEILKSNAKPTVEKTGAERKSFDTQPTQPAKESRSTPVETAKTEKIEDFGEVLQGARKHVYSLSETLDQAIDIKAEPLSKSFPKPDNEKLSAEGMDNRTIYAVNRLRKEIPNKPRASYRIEGWVRNTETTRNLVNSVMKGEVKPEDSLGPSHLIKNKYERELMGLVDEASPAQLDRLADFRLSGAHFSLYHGQKDVDKIQVTDTSKKSGFGGMANKTYFDTMEQAREFIRGEINENVSESGQRQTSFDIWRERGKEGVFLGKKIASRKFIELRQFDDVKQAREYIEQNRAQLEKDLKEKRKKKSFRRVDNNPRVGEDYRQGKDITPAEFEKAFGFRGVQFGNYVEDARRQQDLNNAYDGLRDLAGLLNIPTRAISLNGTLGLAFGARGKGGKNPASAHYEPGGKNINLTKKSGAGSLAHEWWHSLDNYFANMDKDSGFMSDRKRPAYIRPDGNFRESTPADFEVREEVYQAFKEIVRVIQKETGLVERSKEQDGNRTKDYWSTVVEMTARTFENYIIAKAAEQGHQSDYLANIVSEPKAEDAVKEYPYLLATEQPVVTEAFDKLFKTLKTKETDQGVALYTIDDNTAIGGYAEFGNDEATINQVVENAEKVLGFEVPFNIIKNDELPDNTPMAFNPATRDIEVNSNYVLHHDLSTQHMVEEVLHGLDAVSKTNTISASSKVLDMQTGVVAKEAIQHFYNHGVLSDFLDYPLHPRHNLSETEIQAELFARLGTLYLGDPQLLREVLPNAFKIFQPIFRLERTTATGQAESLRGKIWGIRTSLDRKARGQLRYGQNVGRVTSEASREGRESDGLAGIRRAIAQSTRGTDRGATVEFSSKLKRFPSHQNNPDLKPTNPQQDADAAREAAEKITSAAEFIESLKGKGKQAIAKSLALLPRLALEEAGRNLLPEISHYVDIAQKMDADKVHNMEHVLRPEFADQPLSDDDLINKPELFFDVNDIADAWRKLPKPVARAMAELMHDATIEGADPAERFTLQYNPNTIDEQIKAAEIHAKRMAREGGNETEMQELRRLRMLKITEARRREKWEALKPRWKALPREAKQIYRDVRDAYAGRWEQIKQALEERIERADIGGKEKRKLINQLRMQFETAKVEGPYFPLARFGDFWVRAEKTGEEAIFSLAESEYAAKRWVQEMNARGYKAKFGRKLENAPQLEGASISFVTGIHDILAQVPGSQADKVADAVNQLYLQTLPALSIRKSFIHRGKVAGYSQDALRAFSHQMFHGGSQLAKLRYSDQLDDSIQAMKKQIEQASDPVLAASFYEEMVQRNEWAQNPKNARFTTFTSQAAFLWYLTTPAAAVINTTQTALVAYPMLASRYGEAKATKELTRAFADFMRGQGHIEKTLSGDERSAILQLIRDGVIDRTQAHTLAELADTDTSQYSAARHRAMSVVSWLFHHTERFNREVTGLAGYRLARGRGLSHEAAKKEAGKFAVYGSHFDYSNANRARFMQGDVMKMLTIFRQYSLYMTWLMLKKTWDTGFARTKQERNEARRFMVNFGAMIWILSGLQGFPMIQQLLDMVFALFGDDDDDHIDADAQFRQYLVEATGSKQAGELIAKGPLNVVTGLDFHTRTKLTELWHRSPGKDLEAKAWWMDLMGQIAGPFWNIPVDMAIGAQMINEGHYQRGVEKMLPRALGALSKTERFATDGAENMRGDKLQDKFTAWELIGQAFGFTPAHLADRYDENNAKRRAVARIDEQRYDLMNYFALSIRMGDEEARGRVLKKIQDFNRRHPHRQINGDSLKRSMLGKAKRSATGDHGFYASPRQSVGVRDIDFAAER